MYGIKDKNLRVTVRLQENTRNQIEQLVIQGRFKSLSEVIREALEEFLSSNEKGV
jgi:Arc/MetJ-type ribon-helix-helix transcriptional regulator